MKLKSKTENRGPSLAQLSRQPSSVLPGLPVEARVCLIRLRSLGDCVLTTPAIRLLKSYRPDLRLSVVVEDRFAAVYAGNPDIDEILPPSLIAIRKLRPHLTINLHGGAKSVHLAVASSAPLRAAFEHFRWRLLYNLRIPRAQEIFHLERTVHTAEHVASAMFFLGAPQQEIPPARLFASERIRRSQPFVVLHPFASSPEKTWAPAKFFELAQHLQNSAGLQPVFIGGPGDNLDAFPGFEQWRGRHLEEIKNLLAEAALFIGNDSGPAHVAAAFRVPVVLLFGASDPRIWAPWRTPSVVLRSQGGIAGIPVLQAVQAAEQLTTVSH